MKTNKSYPQTDHQKIITPQLVQQNQTKSLMGTKPVQHKEVNEFIKINNRMHFTFRAGCKVEIYFLSMRKHQQ